MKVKDIYVRTDLPTVYLRYQGVWDMDDLYTAMADWFKFRKYKFYEKHVKHKRITPFGADRQYKWYAYQNREDYVRNCVEIYYRTYDTKDIDVVTKDGKKRTFTKGRIFMEFTGYVIYDWEKRWEGSSFYAQLRNYYHKYITKKRMEQVLWDLLWYREISKLHNLIMRKLKMETEEYAHRYWMGVHT